MWYNGGISANNGGGITHLNDRRFADNSELVEIIKPLADLIGELEKVKTNLADIIIQFLKLHLYFSRLAQLNARMSIALVRATNRCIKGSRIPASNMSNRFRWEGGAVLELLKSDN